MNDRPNSAAPVNPLRIRIYLPLLCALLPAAFGLHAQGMFIGYNGSAPTRLGDVNGPLAEATILGQMWAGTAPDSLAPVGGIRGHVRGIWSMGRIEIPGTEPEQRGYVQFWAWDSALWGADPAGVPENQFGRTDVASVLLGGFGPLPPIFEAPRFDTPAIVPIPEPGVWTLLAVGGAALWGMALRSPQTWAGSKR